MSNRFGFFKPVVTLGATTSGDWHFQPNVSISASVANADTVNFYITGNYPSVTLNYNLINVQESDFTDGNITGTIVTDGNGNATFTKTLVTNANYSNTNVEFYANITTTANIELSTSSNIVITPAPTLVATGGTITDTNGWRQHEFISNGTFTVNAVGSGTVYSYIVGAGGMGGGSKRFQEVFGAAFNTWSLQSGGGGAGGVITHANLSATSYTTTNYPIVIGNGGNNLTKYGTASSFKGYSAAGGGEGGSWNIAPTAGFINGGGGSSTFSSWSANTYGPSSTPPPSPTQYDQWLTDTPSILYWDGSTWRTSSYTIAAYIFNNYGKRALNAGGDGTVYDGGNAVVISGDPAPTTRFNAVGGSGAGAGGNGNYNTSNWMSSSLPAGPNGGAGKLVWINYPGYATEYLARGGNGGDNNTRASTPSAATIYGYGGQGAHAGRYASDGTTTTYHNGANGADGIVRIAYEFEKRSFVV